ncbi:peptidoglycan editing factor PgeF [Sphingomicrobium aestuariivivum]|uniref:peptidoglycan editing factor PgeF n=1 Tax=Sphingomicrobium aestuariivivum TaxID=1582356 RepID=UPI001FD6DCCA|nr:peptidoglycan editing factor PgeF [Sphingomicrobium aestuariivivum]MCJ8190879.1 peptidoglycan editing factor PgeF [Sphingomicrobium aestuariivivum]
MSAPPFVTAPPLSGVPHGFFGREGGVSLPPFDSLNTGLGSDDGAEKVRENRRRAADALIEGAPLVGLYQVHSPDVVIVTEPWDEDGRPKADALVTKTPGILLGILTADCAPVLLADREAGVVAAAHAGWRGAIGGVTDKTIGAMLKLGADPRRIHAAVGPCIAQKNFEVGEDMLAPFIEEDPANARFFREGARGKAHFDLESYVAARLAGAGIGTVWLAGEDTYGQPERYYSYRRATHEEAPDNGRQISLIGIAPEAR